MDLFAGFGTALLACKKLKRKGIGIEYDPFRAAYAAKKSGAKILKGDTEKMLDFIPANSIDFIFSDTPFIGYLYTSGKIIKTERAYVKKINRVFEKAVEKLKPNKYIVVGTKNVMYGKTYFPTAHHITTVLLNLGLKPNPEIIWVKKPKTSHKSRRNVNHYYFLVFRKITRR